MNLFKGLARLWKAIQLVLLYLVAAILVYFMFPREGKFRYEYTRNKPWMHETLVAPFDIPIYKPEAQIEAERDSLLKHIHYYFVHDSLVGDRMVQAFEGDVSTLGIAAARSDGAVDPLVFSMNVVSDILKDIYNKGIVERHPVLEGQEADQGMSIMVVKDGVAGEERLNDLFRTRSAYDYLLAEMERINPGTLALNSLVALNDYLRPNVSYDEEMSDRVRMASLDQLTPTQGMVQAGQRIIARGELVSGHNFQVIESLRREYESNPNVGKNYLLVHASQFILISLIFISLLWFVYYFRRDVFESRKQSFFILVLIVSMVGLTMAASTNDAVSVYVIPFVVVPIFLKTFYDIRFALFVHLITLLLAGFWVPNSFQFVLMNLLAGIVGVFAMRSYYRRGILFYTATFVMASYFLVYILLTLMQEGDIQQIDWITVLWLVGNSFLILTVYPLVFIFERIFGFLSDATLFELSDTNQPLLRELAEKAPGTFQHSMQVANLAEEAILQVGGNSLSIRAGALYHDIGKMNNPQYFIENQNIANNPHGELDSKTSAKVIIDHVIQGVEIARKHKLPEQIVDFIRTHHGTSTVQYFYRTYLIDNPGEEVDIREFTYPGPKPYSRETAVLMMADSVEAASRTLKSYTRESIDQLVEGIVARQTEEKQFEEATLTFADITKVKAIFKNRLSNIYHSRIEYPDAPADKKAN